MKKILVRKWLISAVAASGSKDGFQSRGVLVLQGRQTMGKTSWLRNIVPSERRAWFLEGVTLNPEDKDSLKKTASHWIVELGELDATFKKSDISKLKSFITSMADLVRLPFAAEFSEFPRRTVFCGTVNQQDFLIDTTGNSRWWVLPCIQINFRHGLDLQQIWAQVYRLFLEGGEWWLNEEENQRLDELNRNFEASDEVEDLLGSKWSWDRYEEYYKLNCVEWMNATNALKACGMQNPTKAQTRRAGEVLRRLTKREPMRRHGGDRCYLVPSTTFYG
jgi:putative DNA primase/helicase